MKLLDIIDFLITCVIHIAHYVIIIIVLLCIFILIALLIGHRLLKKENTKNNLLQNQYDQAQEKCMVRLIAVGPNKIKIIKMLRDYIMWDLATAKQKIELPLPAIIVTHIPLDLAEKLKIESAKLDTTIEIIKAYPKISDTI